MVVAATGGSGLVVTGQIFSFALKSGSTCAVINGVTYRVVKGGSFKDFKREVCSGFAFGYEAGAVIGTVKFIKASSTVKKSGLNSPSECNISSKQFGKKWGKHKTDYPDLSMDEYKNLIDDVFKSPDKIIQDFENNEFLYLKGNNLLRVTNNGEFVSLYPGAKTTRVLSAIKKGGTIWPK